MTQEERIAKTTEIFKKTGMQSTGDVLNEVQCVIDDYFNEHFSSIAPLELPFYIHNLETRLQLYKADLQQKPDLMFLYNILNVSAKIENRTITEIPNVFAEKDGKADD